MSENTIVVLRSDAVTDQNALLRLQSDAILEGLQDEPHWNAFAMSPQMIQGGSTSFEDTCFVFHYFDKSAISCLRQLRNSNTSITIACLCSDVYNFEEYISVHDIVDFYIAPTVLHRQVLLSQLYRPVYTLPECIDPISGFNEEKALFQDRQGSRRLLWFGYPESFEKGMASLMPVISMNLANQHLDSFSLIIGMYGFENRFNLPLIGYSNQTFAKDAERFDYCILSHFSLDLTLNSFIKSPNKLVTSLMVGLIPIASRTPAYEALLIEFGLERFLFESPSALDNILCNLEPLSDAKIIRDSGIVQTLAKRFSRRTIADQFCEVLTSYRKIGSSRLSSMLPPSAHASSSQEENPELSFTQHLQDLAPSMLRALRRRLNS